MKDLSFWRHDPEAAQPGDQLMGDPKKQDCDLVPDQTVLSFVIDAGFCREEHLASQTSVGKASHDPLLTFRNNPKCRAVRALDGHDHQGSQGTVFFDGRINLVDGPRSIISSPPKFTREAVGAVSVRPNVEPAILRGRLRRWVEVWVSDLVFGGLGVRLFGGLGVRLFGGLGVRVGFWFPARSVP